MGERQRDSTHVEKGKRGETESERERAFEKDYARYVCPKTLVLGLFEAFFHHFNVML